MENIIIERAEILSEQDYQDIGHLMTILKESDRELKVEPKLVKTILLSKTHQLLLARFSGKIVGMATLSLVYGPLAGRKIYLEDFVTDSSVQGKGVGSKLWHEMLAWGREQGATRLDFTSRPVHAAAHSFYLHKGAAIRDTAAFRKEIEAES